MTARAVRKQGVVRGFEFGRMSCVRTAQRRPSFRVAAAVSLVVAVATACAGGAPNGSTSVGTPAAPAVVPASAPAASSVAPAAAASAPGPASVPSVPAAAPPVAVDPAVAALAGTYRCLSRAIYYDNGGGGGTDTCSLIRPLVLGADGNWSWDTASGTWHVGPVTSADWAAWGIAPYGGVTRVLVLDGLGRGPIEPDSGSVWVIYHDTLVAGRIWLKWGRA